MSDSKNTMRKYTLRIYKNVEETCRAAAEAVAALVQETIAARGRFALALSGGTTPKRLYQLLASGPFREKVDWSAVDFFWSDERAVPPEHPESNFRLASETLLKPLGIAENKIHRIPAERPDREEAAQDYQDEIATVLGSASLGDPPTFDLVLLGLGADGHTASLFPATSALQETRRWVMCHHVLKLQADRFTMTPMLINRAANVFFLVTGKNKAEVLAETLEGFIDKQRLPAQLINPSEGKLIWFLDEEAGSKLKKGQDK